MVISFLVSCCSYFFGIQFLLMQSSVFAFLCICVSWCVVAIIDLVYVWGQYWCSCIVMNSVFVASYCDVLSQSELSAISNWNKLIVFMWPQSLNKVKMRNPVLKTVNLPFYFTMYHHYSDRIKVYKTRIIIA